MQPHRRGLAGAGVRARIVLSVETRAKPACAEAGRDGEEAHHVGDHDCGARADQDQAGGESEPARARSAPCRSRPAATAGRAPAPCRAPHSRDCATARRSVSALRPPAPGEHGAEAEQQRDDRGGRANTIVLNGVAQSASRIRQQAALERSRCSQIQRGTTKPSSTGSAQTANASACRACRASTSRGVSCELSAENASCFARGRSVRARSAPATTPASRRQLRRAGEAGAVEPGREDRERQRAHAEIFAGADVVQRLQQHEREADRKRRPRQRQRDVRAASQRSRRACAHFATRRSASGTSRARRDTHKDRARSRSRRSRRAASACWAAGAAASVQRQRRAACVHRAERSKIST